MTHNCEYFIPFLKENQRKQDLLEICCIYLKRNQGDYSLMCVRESKIVNHLSVPDWARERHDAEKNRIGFTDEFPEFYSFRLVFQPVVPSERNEPKKSSFITSGSPSY